MTLCFFFLSLWEINTYKRGKMKPRTYPQSSLTAHYSHLITEITWNRPWHPWAPLTSSSPTPIHNKEGWDFLLSEANAVPSLSGGAGVPGLSPKLQPHHRLQPHPQLQFHPESRLQP